MSAPCQRCPERIRCGVCLSATKWREFSRAPLRVALTREPCVSRARSSGPPFLVTFLAEQKSNPAAGTDSRLVSTAVQPHCVTRRGAGSTVVVDVDVDVDVFKQTTNFTSNCCFAVTSSRLVKQPDCTIVMTRPGVRPGGRPTSFASPKEVGKKRRPGDRAPLRGVPVSAAPGAGRG